MESRVYIDMMVAREKQGDLLRQVEQYRLARLARAGNRARVKAGPRAWDRFACWLRRSRLDRVADRRSGSAEDALRLLALAWIAAKE